MDADTKLDASSGATSALRWTIALRTSTGKVHRVTTLRNSMMLPSPGALDDAAVMHRDGGVDQVAAKGPKANQDAIFICTRKPRVPDRTPKSRPVSGSRSRAIAEARSLVAGGRGMDAFHAAPMRRSGRECGPGVRPVGLAALA
jgi:hypothetical protein